MAEPTTDSQPEQQQDNQSLRDDLIEATAAHRLSSVARASDRVHRHAEAHLKKHYPDIGDEEVSEFKIRSPEHHYHFPAEPKPPPPPPPKNSLLPLITTAAIAAMGGGLLSPVVAKLLTSDDKPPVVKPVDPDDVESAFGIELGPSK